MQLRVNALYEEHVDTTEDIVFTYDMMEPPSKRTRLSSDETSSSH